MKFETLRSNKKILLIGVVFVLVGLTLMLSVTKAKYRTTQRINVAKGTINYSLGDTNLMGVYIQEGEEYVSSDTIPDEGYELNSDESYCKKGDTKLDTTITYDVNTKTLNIAPMAEKGTKCYLYFDAKSLVPASEKIISLVGNGQVFYEGNAGYRYEGTTVDNYVDFNNETWRILAVEEGSKIGLNTNEYYIKLVKEDSIGDLKWDTNHGNTWSSSTLYNVLNNDYLNSTGSYLNNGISEYAKKHIVKANWYTNLVNNYGNYTASEFYNYERIDLTKYVNDYIALIYPSDYGYASPSSICQNTVLYEYESYSSCYDNNWLHKGKYHFYTITPVYDGAVYFLIDYSGDLSYSDTNYAYAIRPSLYLKSDVSFVEGTDGSSTNKFQIAN